MNWIRNFLTKYKYAIIWTLCYVAGAWVIFHGLFNFNLFSYANWSRLAHAQLVGFPGFVFGVLMLCALPLYVATMAIIIRTGAPLFTIPIPEFMRATPIEAPATPASATDDPAPQSTAPAPLSPDIPLELRNAFMRARENPGREQISMVDTRTIDSEIKTSAPTPDDGASAEPVTGLPLPTDFDISAPQDEAPDGNFEMSGFSAPVFTEINFDEPDITPAAPAPVPQGGSMPEYLNANNIHINATENDIIITDKFAIAIHDDPDFWVAENDNWFATGRQKSSPIPELVNIAHAHNVTPVLYLAATNIMDLDAHRAEWERDGITVITQPNELPK